MKDFHAKGIGSTFGSSLKGVFPPGFLFSLLTLPSGKDVRLPRVLFTDRGAGMYSPHGHVVRVYEAAVEKTGLRLYWGPNAQQQSPDLGDVLLHETAVSPGCVLGSGRPSL